jgi:hypothetical protein
MDYVSKKKVKTTTKVFATSILAMAKTESVLP